MAAWPVYLARDVRHDRYVALKLLDPEIGAVLGVVRIGAAVASALEYAHAHG